MSRSRKRPKNRGKVVILHLAGHMPLAGIAWQAMHYILGFEKLGYETWYVEDGGANPYDPVNATPILQSDHAVSFIEKMMSAFGLGDRWAYWDAIYNKYYGLSESQIRQLYTDADILINLCGATSLRDEHLACKCRVLIDTDPVYQQIKYANGDVEVIEYLKAHTHLFTYGENINAADSPIPPSDLTWHPTRPPVDVDLWSNSTTNLTPVFSTIGTWSNLGKDIEYAGVNYIWSRHVNALRFIKVPTMRPEVAFTLATTPPTPDIADLLRTNRWNVIDPVPLSIDMRMYADFIKNAYAEFTVTKSMYVEANTGWFSDRSATFLAAGRPVITQKTGFERIYAPQRGLFYFDCEEEICHGVDQICADYSLQSKEARAVARDIFNFDVVINDILRVIEE